MNYYKKNQVEDLSKYHFAFINVEENNNVFKITLNRPEKIKPLLSVTDRKMTLMALKGITEVSSYNTEEELLQLIIDINPEIRFLGEDYINRTNYTGHGLAPKIIFLNRNHGWSTTKFKKLIANSIK